MLLDQIFRWSRDHMHGRTRAQAPTKPSDRFYEYTPGFFGGHGPLRVKDREHMLVVDLGLCIDRCEHPGFDDWLLIGFHDPGSDFVDDKIFQFQGTQRDLMRALDRDEPLSVGVMDRWDFGHLIEDIPEIAALVGVVMKPGRNPEDQGQRLKQNSSLFF